MNQEICTAIRSKRYMVFDYDGLPREIEPHAHGTSSTGKEMVLGFQTAGQSASGPLGWRLWDVAKMKSLDLSDCAFSDTRSDYVRDDTRMKPMHCQL